MKFPHLSLPNIFKPLLIFCLLIFSANQLNVFWNWFRPLVKPPPTINEYAGKTMIFPTVTKAKNPGDLTPEVTVTGNDACEVFIFDLKDGWSDTLRGVFGRGCFLKVTEGFAEYHLQNSSEIIMIQENRVVDLSNKKFRIRGHGKAAMVYTAFVMLQ